MLSNIKFNILTLAATAFCLSSRVQASPFHQSPCNRTGYDQSFNELVQKISIIGTDDRGPLLTKGPQLGLSPAEIKQIRQSTGYIVCPGTKFNNGTAASASLIGSNGQIITNAHAIQDEQGRFREPLSSCFFQNQDKPYRRVPLDITKPENYRMGADYTGRHSQDYLIAKLKTFPNGKNPLAGVKPFPIDLSQNALRVNQTMYVISAGQEDIKTNRDQPILQSCTVGDVGYDGPTIIYGRCDIMNGASGGAHLVRNSDGQLVMKAIISRGGIGIDGEEYNKSAGVYSYSIGIDGPVLDAVKSIYPSLAVGNGAVDDNRGI